MAALTPTHWACSRLSWGGIGNLLIIDAATTVDAA